MKLVLLALIACSVLFVGCVSVPMTSAALDSEAKKFAVETDKANIYVNLTSSIDTGPMIQIVLDGRVVGSLSPNTYQLLNVSPGEHTVTVIGAENVRQQKLTVEAGKNYFLKVSAHMGWNAARVNLEPLNEEQGREEVMNSKRAETTNYQ